METLPTPLLPLLPQGLLRDKGEAREIFLKYGLPQRRSPCAESWKYTPLNALADTRLVLPRAGKTLGKTSAKVSAKASAEHLLATTPSLAHFPDALRLLFIDGRLQAPHPLTAYAGLAPSSAQQPMAALNLASRCEAWRLRLDDETPFVHIVSLASGEQEETSRNSSSEVSSRLLQTRLRIEVAAETKATIFQSSLHGAERCWTNDFFEIEVAAAASCEHIVLQASASTSHCFTSGIVRVGGGGHYAQVSALRGKGLTRQGISVALEGEEASCALHGAYHSEGAGHIDNSTEIIHARPHCTSDALYKGVIADRGCGVFHGKIYVARDAQATEGYQLSRALLLSPQARAYHKPELEIYADDVKCSHGATVGTLDEEQIFYLRSRGLPPAKAQELLLEAFLCEALTCQRADCAQALHKHILPQAL